MSTPRRQRRATFPSALGGGARCATGGAMIVRSQGLLSFELAREQGWTKSLVQFAFGACHDVEVHSELTVAEAQAAVLRASATWNRAGLPLRLEPTDDADKADIVVAWKFGSADPEGALDWQTQAHADFPPGNSLFGPPLPVHFNADFLWGIESPGCFDVETIALHELGHCLGLIYHSGLDTIMYAAIREAPFFVRHQIDPETLARVRLIYSD